MPGAASTREIQENQEKINHSVHADARTRGQSLLVALSFVSEKSRNTAEPMDPASLLTLLRGEFTDSMPKLPELWASTPFDKNWESLFRKIYQALVTYQEQKPSASEASGINEDPELVRNLANKLEELKHDFYSRVDQSQQRKSIRNWLSSHLSRFAGHTGKSIVLQALFNYSGYEFYRKFRGVILDSRTIRSSAKQFNIDYDGSVALTATTLMQNYGGIF
ncbi:MAG: hypothetical protein C5B49_00105 [Bdellovibrio sp.]|nr:MAG: hypothetical protein C5B49_00105 [Bdellovibrio sp.]